ncbi:YcjF family protein [Litoreibacter roseus]|uniref:TIGR01620 family protein n=1 Tax=Litoreibacter roseus TaxID=2601869 RepID=A0A6N6JFX0_9RHOB|nr:TIGR01620 family protein [Litoreibacter roseus]GFE65251.1 TIGR01620 family protein [Litoreibacter roseus]
MSGAKPKGPVLFDLDDAPQITEPVTPATAPVVPDLDTPKPSGQAMKTLAVVAARPRNRLVGLFWSALLSLIGFAVSVAAWDFVTGLLERNAVLGTIAMVLIGVVLIALLLLAGREWIAIGRLKRIDTLRVEAEAALTTGDLGAARRVRDQLLTLYSKRPGLDAARATVKERASDSFDADAALDLAERHLLAPLDAAAKAEVEAAARQVATVTAIVPIALADLIAALTANLRMIRRIAEIYGGRSGTLGNWRLTRAVMTHLVATGAVAVGDDMISSIAGGGVLSRISRRFGEGIINGALTARVGVAAIEVCRPLPFHAEKPPSVTRLMQRALTGLIPSGSATPKD